MTTIKLAYDGRVEMLNAIFGGKPAPGPAKIDAPKPMNADAIRAIFRGIAASARKPK